MIQIMQISQDGIDFIEKAENFEPFVYKCSKGASNIGFGRKLKDCCIDLVKAISPISIESARILMKKDLKSIKKTINKEVKVNLNQKQYDALTSLVYNWGGFNFKNSRGLKRLNEGKFKDAEIEFFSEEKGVVKVNGMVSKGLLSRRKLEREMWNENQEK